MAHDNNNNSTIKSILIEDQFGYEDEDFGEPNDIVEVDKPFDSKKVDVSITTPNLGTLIGRLEQNEIDLMPDFQRSGDLWSKQQQSRLIESILIRLPIPAFYFDALNDEKWQVVDGLQRLSAIKNFVLNKKLYLTNLEFLNEYEGYTYDKLPRSLQRRIYEFQVSAYLIKPGTPLMMKYSLFNRINTGGLKLTPQEIRHAMSQSINKGRASLFLSKIVNENVFRKVVGTPAKRMASNELVLRHMTFILFGAQTYKSSLPKFLDAGMTKLGELSITKLDDLQSNFIAAMNTAYELFGIHAFRKTLAEPYRNKVVNKPLFEAVSVNLALINDAARSKLCENKKSFKDEFKIMLTNDNFDYSITRSTANTDNVQARFNMVEEIINRYI